MDLLIQIHCRLSKNDFHAVYYLLNKIMSPMKHTTTLLLLIALHLHGFAQTPEPPDPIQHSWQQHFDRLADYDDIENDNLDDLYELLCELETSPINLNTATDDEIKQLSFLNSSQTEELIEYLDRYRPLRSIGELSMLQSLDPVRLQLLRCFVYINNVEKEEKYPTLKNILKYGKHELVATTSIPCYNRKGDRKGYLGYKYKHWMRYTFKYGQYLKIGLTGTQDAGEPFFSSGNNMGYDHYAYYAIIRKLGILKTLALGQYKMRFGMGLTINTSFTLGKTTSLVLSTPSNTISPNSSRSDAYYLQGAAATIALGKNIDLTSFVSYRKIDATLNSDGSIKTLLHTGYHRTMSEMQRKHNSSQLATGLSLRWRKDGLHFGANAIYTSFNRELHPNTTQLFRKYDPAGNNFHNGSIDYGFINHRININGETAINNNGAIATLNSLSLKANSSLTLTAIQRYYSYRYYSLLGASFSDGGKVQNESGVYIGAAWTPLARLSILAYTDFAYFPWARYTASLSSHSWDNMVQATYNLSLKTNLTARYRVKLKQENYTYKNDKNILINKTEHRVRLIFAYNDNHWQAKTQLDGACVLFPFNLPNKQNSFGGMLSQTLSYNHNSLNIAANVGYFHTNDYNSRIYIYERGSLYTFSFPMFYGRGMRTAIFAKGKVGSSIIVIGKVGTTKYFDRDVISSSYQQINSSWKTDVDLQVKWSF